MAGSYIPPRLADTPLPELFTLIAQHNSQRPFVQIIREHASAPTDCIRFTWEEVIKHAQNAAADLRHRWTESLKTSDASNKAAEPRQPGSALVVVGVLANNGYELYINVIACTLNRWTALLMSPKNSPAAIEHLLRTTDSSLFIVEPNNLALGHMMEQAIPGLNAQAIATLDRLATERVSPSLTLLTQEQLKKEMELPVFYLHTSGSTGHPKIIPWSHEFVLSGARARRRDRDEWIGLPLYSVPPLIHAAGMIMYFMYAPAHGNLMNFVSSPTPKPPSAGSLLAHLPFVEDGILIVTPSILEDLCSLGPEAVKTVAAGTKLVSYTGAPLKAATGDALALSGMNLQARYGSTEINCGSTHILPRQPEDWQYIQFREGYNWHLLGVDDHSNLRELIVGPGTDGCPAVINHENPRGYATNDVWEPHPTVSELWRHHSRKGDVTVLSNGEKSDNKQIEDLLLQDKRILYVQVFGAGRPMNGVVIQPADPATRTSVFLSHIQPTIKHANSILPTHSRLVPELVIVATPDRPFAATDKGTIKKKETLDKFEGDIEAAYDALEEGGAAGAGAGAEWAFEGNASDEGDIRKFVRSAVQSILGKEVPDHGDLFAYGFDSLLSIRLRMAVVSAVKRTPTSSRVVPRNIVYTFPSINALTTYLLSRAETGTPDPQDAIDERVRRSIAKYSANFVPHRPGPTRKQVYGKVVALSGSTGNVGSSILGLLLARVDVEKVYLLNRSGNESQEVRQTKGLQEKGLDPMILELKKGSIVYLDVDFSRSDLGLAESAYGDLRDSVTHIIHAAWQLNFNFVVESYERVHIAGVRHLIDLALSSPHPQPPRLTFLSTIGAAMLYKGPTQEPSIGDSGGQVLVPETPIDDPSMSLDQGYGHSKYVSERVIVNAVDAGLRATIVRVAQLSGVTTNGAWAMNEYVPIMLRSSIALGLAPHDLPAFRWVPCDIAASALIKQAFDDSSRLEYFSIDNPFPTPWSVVNQALSAVSPKQLRFIPLATWLEHIRKTNPDPREVPATKLLDFYESRFLGAPVTAALGWEKSVKLAPELGAGPISVELVKKYILYQQQNSGKL